MNNNLRTVYNIFEEIRQCGSTNNKKTIIAKYKDNKDFLYYLKFLANPHAKTGLSKSKLNKCVDCSPTITFKSLREILDYLVINNTGSDAIIRGVQSYINTMIEDNDLYEFAKSLIAKYYKLGANIKLINSVIPNLIPTSEGKEDIQVMLATKFDLNKYNGEMMYVTEKMDGFRCNIIIRNGIVEMYTRQGKLIRGCKDIEESMLKLDIDNFVFDGELLAKDCGYESIYKETSKRVKNKNEIKTGVEFRIFDMISIKEFDDKKGVITYEKRRKNIDKLKENEFIKKLPILYRGYDIDKVADLFVKYVKRGAEGLMINYNKIYEFGKRSKAIQKFKPVYTSDLRVLDLIEGDGQDNKGKLGAIIVEFIHLDKHWSCKIGTGNMKDDELKLYWDRKDLILGKIIECYHYGVTINKEKSYGLRHGGYVRLRDDKDEISMY